MRVITNICSTRLILSLHPSKMYIYHKSCGLNVWLHTLQVGDSLPAVYLTYWKQNHRVRVIQREMHHCCKATSKVFLHRSCTYDSTLRSHSKHFQRGCVPWFFLTVPRKICNTFLCAWYWIIVFQVIAVDIRPASHWLESMQTSFLTSKYNQGCNPLK